MPLVTENEVVEFAVEVALSVLREGDKLFDDLIMDDVRKHTAMYYASNWEDGRAWISKNWMRIKLEAYGRFYEEEQTMTAQSLGLYGEAKQ